MKLKELKKILKELGEDCDDFEIEMCSHVYGRSDYGLDIDTYKLNQLSDVGYSGKVLIFEIEEVE